MMELKTFTLFWDSKENRWTDTQPRARHEVGKLIRGGKILYEFRNVPEEMTREQLAAGLRVFKAPADRFHLDYCDRHQWGLSGTQTQAAAEPRKAGSLTLNNEAQLGQRLSSWDSMELERYAPNDRQMKALKGYLRAGFHLTAFSKMTHQDAGSFTLIRELSNGVKTWRSTRVLYVERSGEFKIAHKNHELI